LQVSALLCWLNVGADGGFVKADCFGEERSVDMVRTPLRTSSERRQRDGARTSRLLLWLRL